MTETKQNETKFMLFVTFVVRGFNGQYTPILAQLFVKQSCATEIYCTRLQNWYCTQFCIIYHFWCRFSLLDKVMSRKQWHIGVPRRHLMLKGHMQFNYNVLVVTHFFQWQCFGLYNDSNLSFYLVIYFNSCAVISNVISSFQCHLLLLYFHFWNDRNNTKQENLSKANRLPADRYGGCVPFQDLKCPCGRGKGDPHDVSHGGTSLWTERHDWKHYLLTNYIYRR